MAECAVPSPFAGHAVNPSLGARWRQGHRTRQFAGLVEKRGTPRRWLLAALKTLHTDQLHWSLPAHRRVTLGGMDAAKELTRTYLQRVLRW
ncbi:conserved hypothetical protein [Xanthomonas citri pv. fuscans]|nr:conserved hypothetical protein [Xanthomonas citri pv. fuscans]SOO11774.1 conserved hypothetical protein [Xanthomonas citri pv. fuscans]SOO12574.1 conserved hypothetical protein [Xanthomonas citri pv. fuscans]SOO43261.1 conserved hypothetical protein [Xanthomonas citri pv. fuscans]